MNNGLIEHLVDCVLYLEGEKFSQFRILRAQKNRFGPTDEVGVFEMNNGGLAEVAKPTAFLDESVQKATGKAVVGIAEGSRSLFFEVQSLVVPTVLAVPRRVVSGVDYNKVQLLLAVIRKNLNLPMDKFDIYVSVVGGVSIKSTAADLGIVASILSSTQNIFLSQKAVFIGEVGLSGELRKILGEEKVIKEASRYGLAPVYSSKNIKTIKDLKAIVK
jgi:DNA repair protein RadA/Sms